MLGFRTKPEMSKPGLALNETRKKKNWISPDPPLGSIFKNIYLEHQDRLIGRKSV